jgi:hypothetical protein
MVLTPQSIDSFFALFYGFAFAGLFATGFELLTQRRASFHLLQTGDVIAAVCVPLVVFSAPFIIIRNTIRGRRYERRNMLSVIVATFLACFWALMSGRVVLDATYFLIGS